MSLAEVIFYRSDPGETLTSEALVDTELEPNDGVIEIKEGTHRFILVKNSDGDSIAKSILVTCLEDGNATRIAEIAPGPEYNEICNERLLKDSQRWFPIPTNSDDKIWILVRHQLSPDRNIGHRIHDL